MLDNYLTVGNTQFEIHYMEGDRQYADEALCVLMGALGNIANYFQLTGSFPKVSVVLVTDRQEFDRLVRDLLQIEIEVPSHRARIAQPQRTEMVVISPSAYDEHTIFEYAPEAFGRLLVHELVHMIEEYLSPNIEESLRWWGEGLAVYFSRQWEYDDEYRNPAIDGVAQNAIPGFQQIEKESKFAYDWGWTIVQFIEMKYGKEMIVRIVKECGDGNVFSVIGEEAEGMESQWMQWLLTQGVFWRDESNPSFKA